MAGTVFDSALFGRLFDAGEVARLFSDSAEIRAMLLVEGALAQMQGARGLIPELSAAAIHRAAMEIQIDPGALAEATGVNGVAVPALVSAFRAAMSAPEHAQYVHWGATSQDIADTALMLRLRQALGLVAADVDALLDRLAELARTHARLPMTARTYGQYATVTSFGAVIAAWGWPLLRLAGELKAVRRDCLLVSLSGAAGTASQLGPEPGALRADLAEALGLGDPGRNWHTDRTPLLKIADWLERVCLALGKIGEDLSDLTASGIGEVRLSGVGASSTMPNKENPVAAAVLVAVARQSTALAGALRGAAMPRHQRDGAAWFTEWMCLPQIVLGAAAAALTGRNLVNALTPVPEAMAASLSGDGGMIHAEALSFALAATMPRPEAQAAVKALCQEARETVTSLAQLTARDFPQLDAASLFDPARQMGEAPAEALGFAQAVRART